MGRPADKKKRKYTAIDKAYLRKTAKKRADRNADHRELEKKTGKKLSPKAKGSSHTGKGCKTESGHTTDYSKGGTKSTPTKAQCVKKNRGWRKGKKGDGGRAAARAKK